MTEKSNDLSDKDKATQASNSEETKSIDNETNAQAGDKVPVDEISESDSSVESLSKEGEPAELEDSKTIAEENENIQDSSPKEAQSSDEEKISSEQADGKIVTSEEAHDEDESVEEDEEEHHDEEIDITSLSKIELVSLLKSKVKQDNIYKIDKIVHEIKAAFEDFVSKEKDDALEKFKADGGVEDDFDFRPSDEEKEFNTYYYEYRHQLGALRKEAEKQKESNLSAKTELLNKLRELVDGEETTLSMATIKALQEEWKSIGPVPPSQNRSLWASYNALMDRFYDNRSIYFELKELDRKKNLESKLELVEKAEALKDVKDLKEAIKSLTDLHEEFKHIGPVPREEQEALWQKFKGASDAVYDRRKDFYEGQKEVFKVNQDQKEALIETLKTFAEFKADRIRDWNSKTKEILEIQKKWEKIGPVPRESGKEIN